MKLGLLITARLKSTRLPLKLLLQLQGREVLRHVIDRAKMVYGIDQIVLCTSTDPQDSPLVEIAKQEDIHYYMGDGVDVLKRLRDAANFYGIDAFISITADNPFFCTYHANRVSDLLRKKTNTDYVYIEGLPIGLAVYGLRTKALDVVCEFKKDLDTEIWGVWVNHPNVLNVASLMAEDLWQFDARLTLDHSEDLLFTQSLLQSVQIPLGKLNTLDIKMAMERNPELRLINNHIVQKGLDQDYVANVSELVNKHKEKLRMDLGHTGV